MSQIDPGMGKIITTRDNTVPLPPGYRTDLPDKDPVNHEAYEMFHNRIGRLMADTQVGPWAKIVMATYLLHGSGTSDRKICKICGLSLLQLTGIQIKLMRYGWLQVRESEQE